jgi:hypothetical protein
LNSDVNSGASGGRPLARWATASGACSCSISSAICSRMAVIADRAVSSAVRPRTGRVLMNRPGARSAPLPAFIRPTRTVPKTTSERPDIAASARAQATWNTVAGLVPRRRATLRRRSTTSPST